jgi:WD40 repeat protein
LSTAKDSSCRVWDSNRGTLLHVLQEESDVVDGTHCYGAAWITDAKVILTTHDDGTCRAWEYPYSSSSRSLLPDQVRSASVNRRMHLFTSSDLRTWSI